MSACERIHLEYDIVGDKNERRKLANKTNFGAKPVDYGASTIIKLARLSTTHNNGLPPIR
jgi:hypothetical protein